jgi:hypothetical protein
MGLTEGVTGGHGMYPSPRHLITLVCNVVFLKVHVYPILICISYRTSDMYDSSLFMQFHTHELLSKENCLLTRPEPFGTPRPLLRKKSRTSHGGHVWRTSCK